MDPDFAGPLIASVMYSFKDSFSTKFYLGMAFPTILVIVVVFNLYFSKVILPGGRYEEPKVYSDLKIVYSVVCMKLSVSYLLFTWYYLANIDKYEDIISFHMKYGFTLLAISSIYFLYYFFFISI